MEVETTDDVVRITVDLSVPPQQVWTLLTEQRHIASWWGDHVELHARYGGAFRETWSDGGRTIVTSGEVTRYDPPGALDMTWADEWCGETEVAFRLFEHGAGTRVVLNHSGWGPHPPSQRQKLIDDHADGWSRYLTRLAEYATQIGADSRERR